MYFLKKCKIINAYFFFRRPENVKVPDWLWDGVGGGPKGPRRFRPTTSQGLLRFQVGGKRGKKSNKSQTKVIFDVELTPLQHIKKCDL